MTIEDIDRRAHTGRPSWETRVPMTLSQKILAHHARGLTRPWVATGDVIRMRVDWTIASELAWGGMDRTYGLLGRPKVHDPTRVFLAVDHTADPVSLARDPRAQRLQALSRRFATDAHIRHFYDANTTILHTKFYRDLVQPGQIVLGADSHTTSHGGMGVFAIGLGGADVTAAMLLGESWLEVPEAIRVDFHGEPAFGIGGKDIVLKVLKDLGRNRAALERSVEYGGDGVRAWSTDLRFTIANMTAELGGLNGIFEADEVIANWLAQRASDNTDARYFRADDGAPYAERYTIELDRLPPLVAKPFSPDNVCDVTALAGHPLDGCFIGACTTTEEELVLGALVLEQAWADNQARPPSAKQLVIPGDISIRARLAERGLWAHYERAGFRVGAPGCSMCLAVASEKALPGETWLSSQNRNYENRMGPGSLAYLASAATVAASALGMSIADPRPYLARIDQDRYHRLLGRQHSRPIPEIRSQEPEIDVVVRKETPRPTDLQEERTVIRGKVQRFYDNVDTDAIIPGQFCHLADLTALGEKAFHFVRPEFYGHAQIGRTVIVAGEAFGTGSSREQAVWALIGAGVRAIVAKSFAFIHKRNLVNDALPFLVIRDPEFFAQVAEDTEIEIEVGVGKLTFVASGATFFAEAPSPVASALQREGGLVSALSHHGRNTFERLSR